MESLYSFNSNTAHLDWTFIIAALAAFIALGLIFFFTTKKVPHSQQKQNHLISLLLGFAFLIHALPGVFDADYMAGFAGFMETYDMPMPTIMSYLCKGGELICGILLILGLFTRFAAVGIMIDMLIATFFAMRGDIFGDFQAEISFTYLIIAFVLFLSKATRFSLDRNLWKDKRMKLN